MIKRLAAVAFVLALSCAAALAQATVAQTTNSSVLIATGNTFQTVLAAITQTNQRRSLTVVNNNASDSCWLYVGSGTAAKGTSILLLPGGSYTRYFPYIPNDALQATCTTTADTLYVDVQ